MRYGNRRRVLGNGLSLNLNYFVFWLTFHRKIQVKGGSDVCADVLCNGAGLRGVDNFFALVETV